MKSTIYRRWFKVSLKFCPLIILCSLSFDYFSGDLKIGAARVRITPPDGTPMAGYYSDRGSTTVHDDLYAKALVIEKDGAKIAIISCDLISVPAEIVSKVRSIVEKTLGIKSDNVMVSATHSHTGPVIPKKNDRYTITGKTADIHTKYISELPGFDSRER